jgi:hypothetical protein
MYWDGQTCRPSWNFKTIPWYPLLSLDILFSRYLLIVECLQVFELKSVAETWLTWINRRYFNIIHIDHKPRFTSRSADSRSQGRQTVSKFLHGFLFAHNLYKSSSLNFIFSELMKKVWEGVDIDTDRAIFRVSSLDLVKEMDRRRL